MTHKQELEQAVIEAQEWVYDDLVELQPKINNPDFDKHVADYRAQLDKKIENSN